tara:strand:- start:1395 stop:1976 length:582 start_codon:yes stop_codon:yes gene_type:complete
MKYSLPVDIDIDIEYIKMLFKQNYAHLFEQKDEYHSYRFIAIDIKEDVGLDDISDQLDSPFSVQRFFRTRANTNGPIHIDCNRATKERREWAINVPLFNCDNSYMEWFDHDDFGEFSWWPEAGFIKPPQDEMDDFELKIKPSERIILESSMLVETKSMHRVYNLDNPHDRIIYSIRGDNSITYEEIYERLANG